MSSPSELTEDNHKLLHMITDPNGMYNICVAVFCVSGSFKLVHSYVVCCFGMRCEHKLSIIESEI